MELALTPRSVVVFDLDDTLYKEADFVLSGFRAVLVTLGLGQDSDALEQLVAWQRDGQPVFDRLAEQVGGAAQAADLLAIYRHHLPKIALAAGASSLLDAVSEVEAALALVTDGRSVTQRNKIAALGLEGRFGCVIISEEVGYTKPDHAGFIIVERAFPEASDFTYIADNPRKDFIAPNALGWRTIQLDDDGRNIHGQRVPVPRSATPTHQVSAFSDIHVGSPSPSLLH